MEERDRKKRRAELLAWWQRERRDLPWRATRDSWSVLVSEVMLQQTQVARVLPKYQEFLERFPTPAACAQGTPAQVIRLWAGLGYNRRALNLHRCAEKIVARHGGSLPGDLDALLALPGLGPYTARAVLAFAFEQDVGVVDTNSARVLARWHDRTFTALQAQGSADAEVPLDEGWAWNQAMLDLGATVCTKREPRCQRCPVAQWCGWRGQGQDPAIGTAGVSGPQSTFSGSDRQGRGRLIAALRLAPVEPDDAATVLGWPDDPARCQRVISDLIADGMVHRSQGRLNLPG